MAHRPIGAGISLSTTAVSGMTTSFAVKTTNLRIVAVTAGAFVAIGTNPTATTSNYYIAAGETETLALTRASNRVVGIATGATTTIVFPEGTQSPFGVGDFITLEVSNQPYYNFNHVEVVSVDTSADYNGGFQRSIVINYDSSGIVTAFSSPDATAYHSQRVAARTEGSSGVVYIQQVQTTSNA
jgi:hypothetical protein